MRKSFYLILIILLALATTASATRVTTMGGVGHIVKDVKNIFEYPQLITQYPDAMYLEISGANLYSVGGHYAISNGVLGMYFTTEQINYPHAPNVDPNNRNWGAYHQRIYLFFGADLNGLLIGGQLRLIGNAHSADKDSSQYIPKDKSVESVTGLGLNLGATFMENIDAYFTFQNVSWTHEDRDGEMITEPKGYMTIGFGGRARLEMSETYSLIPYASLKMEGQGYKRAADTTEVKSSSTAITIGVGDNIAVSENALVVSDIGIKFKPGKTETTRPDTSFETKA